jgi:hypothetical protein
VLYLEAEAAGIRAIEIRCSFADKMHALLGQRVDEWQSLITSPLVVQGTIHARPRIPAYAFAQSRSVTSSTR